MWTPSTMMEVIEKNGLIGHTFNREIKRPYRIVIRNLHYTTALCIVKQTIENS